MSPAVLTKRKLDEETLDELEEVLIKADLGPAMAGRVREELANRAMKKASRRRPCARCWPPKSPKCCSPWRSRSR